MTSDEKKATLLSLLANLENEVVEFKSGGKSFSSDENEVGVMVRVAQRIAAV